MLHLIVPLRDSRRGYGCFRIAHRNKGYHAFSAACGESSVSLFQLRILTEMEEDLRICLSRGSYVIGDDDEAAANGQYRARDERTFIRIAHMGGLEVFVWTFYHCIAEDRGRK